MTFINSTSFKKYFMPGLVFQGVIIGAGYGTGREIVEFFLQRGPLGGLLGLGLITALVWSVMLAVSFEFSRIFRAHDYRTFCMTLLGRYWFIFEIIYILLMLVVLAVIGSAAGVLLRDNFGIPYMAGVALMLAAIGFLAFKGTGLIEKFLSLWSILIYAVYAVFLIATFLKFGPQIQENFREAAILPKWALGGFKYALYNIAVIPALLFCTKHMETRKEAISSGLLAGWIGSIPAILFLFALSSHYPAVLSEEIPAVFVLKKIGLTSLIITFQIVLFGTLIQTGIGFLHGFNERIQSNLLAKGKSLPQKMRPIISSTLLLLGLGLSPIGIISLVAKGYGNLSWGVFIILFIPLLTIGIAKIAKEGKHKL